MEEKIKLKIFLRTLLNVSCYYRLYTSNRDRENLPIFKFFEPIAKVKTYYSNIDLIDFVSVKLTDINILSNEMGEVSMKSLEDYIVNNTCEPFFKKGIYFAHYLLPEISFDLLVFMIDSYFSYYRRKYPETDNVKRLANRVIRNYNMLSDVVEEVDKLTLINNKIMDLNYTIGTLDEK